MSSHDPDPLHGLELRTAATPEDIRRFLAPLEIAFAEDIPDEDWTDLTATLPPDRTLGVFEGERPVGSAGDIPFRITVPGGTRVPVAGVTVVGVLPTHRRRGILRWLMGEQLGRIHQRGEPLAVLWASEGAIYQRFGYGLATFGVEFDIERIRTAFARPVPPRGLVRLVDEREALDRFPAIYDRVGGRTPGMLERSGDWWRHSTLRDSERRRNELGRKRLALLEVHGDAAAYAIHRIKPDWDGRGPKGVLHALEVIGIDADAEGEMWSWLFGVDLVGSIHGYSGRLPHPLMLRLLEPRRLGLTVGDGLWLRLVDVPAALEARGYAAPGSIVLEVLDGMCSWNAGRWRLTVDGRPGAVPGPSRAGRVEPTGDEPDLSLEAADLGAIYLGGTRLVELADAGRVRAVDPASIALASAMFASDVTPWCCTPF